MRAAGRQARKARFAAWREIALPSMVKISRLPPAGDEC
jgi:hypothetical protein